MRLTQPRPFRNAVLRSVGSIEHHPVSPANERSGRSQMCRATVMPPGANRREAGADAWSYRLGKIELQKVTNTSNGV
jgi:hypothetical protein